MRKEPGGRWRISLRELFLITAIVALACGWWNDRRQLVPAMREMREARRRLSDLQKSYDTLKGIVKRHNTIDYMLSRGITVLLSPENVCLDERHGDADLYHLQHAGFVKNLLIDGARITDDGLADIRYANVQGLTIRGVPLSERSVEMISQFQTLNYLIFFDGTCVTDSHMKHLASMKWLQSLRLLNETVTGRTLALMAGCRSLRVLRVHKIVDAGSGVRELALHSRLRHLELTASAGETLEVTQLAGFNSLEWLGLHGVHLTAQGVDVLAELPNLEELWLSGTIAPELVERLKQLDLQTLYVNGGRVKSKPL